MMAIYHRTFTIPPFLSTTSTGQLVNQMSADATRYLNVMPALIMMLSAPAFITISVSFLFYVLGPSILVGLAIMILYVPVVRKCGLVQKRCQEQKMKLGDERVRITGEVISGIRVLKFYAWEGPSRDMISDARSLETSKLLSFWLWQAISMVLALICPTLVLVATFATYYFAHGKMPPISDTFLALSMFKLIQLPFKAFSEGVSATSQALVSFRRLEGFISTEKVRLDEERRLERSDSKGIIPPSDITNNFPLVAAQASRKKPKSSSQRGLLHSPHAALW